ncbi:hypothetical protein ES703_54461 [subsurface metagenome]
MRQKYRVGELIFQSPRGPILQPWIFHDEDWIRVIGRHEHRKLVAAGQVPDVIDNVQQLTPEVSVSDDEAILFDGKTMTKDEWLYLYLDPRTYQWRNYSWQFRVQRWTHFKELQFGIRYQDFYNRYRYRFQDDYIYFDKVVRGRFFNAFSSVPFKMELGIWYDVRIDAYQNNFRLYVDGNLMLNDYDFENLLPLGPVAIILWEDDGITDIKAAIGPMSVHELVF